MSCRLFFDLLGSDFAKQTKYAVGHMECKRPCISVLELWQFDMTTGVHEKNTEPLYSAFKIVYSPFRETGNINSHIGAFILKRIK